MTVECPRCGTAYRLAARHQRRRTATYECARCHHVFGPSEPEAEEAEWDDDEPFVFDDQDRASASDEDGDIEEDVEDEEDEVEEAEEEDEEDDADEEEPAPKRRKARAAKKRPGSVGESTPARFALRAMLAIVLIYGVVAIYFSTHRARAHELLRRIPIVGERLARTPVGARHIALHDVRGDYHRALDGKAGASVFVVTATATNRAKIPVERIELSVRLEGAQAREKTIPCTGTVGNVRGHLSLRELELLAGLARARTSPVSPGESILCQAIFPDPPPSMSSVVVEVLRAHGG